MTGPTITEIIARLGHACRLPWARCGSTAARTASDPPVQCLAQCLSARGHGDGHGFEASVYPSSISADLLPPTLAEWQAEYEREHPGEPGPIASWTSEDGRVSWSVFGGGSIRIAVGRVFAFAWACDSQEWCLDGRASSADWAEAVRLMQAADGGGG